MLESDVVAELVPLQEEISSQPIEVEALPIDTHMELSKEPTMELFLLAMLFLSLLLRSPNIYDSLQIFLRETGSQEIMLLMVQSAVNSVFIMDDSHSSVIYDWLDLSSVTARGANWAGSARQPHRPVPCELGLCPARASRALSMSRPRPAPLPGTCLGGANVALGRA